MISSVDPSPAGGHPIKGVTLTGYLRAELGLGQTARLMTGVVEVAGEKLSTHVWSLTESRQNHPWNGKTDVFEPHYDTNLICINADRLVTFARAMGPGFFRDRYNIGLWFWETETFPVAMCPAFNFVQEIWVTSQFVRDAMAKVSPVPIFVIPHPLNLNPDIAAVSRSDLGLPDGFMFLFSFDLFSVLERKNPIGLIRAFKRAFAPGEGPILVLKSINGHRKGAELEQLHYECEGRTDIHIRDGYLDEVQKNALAASCDCYVSLHRSEGFGQTIAEAMLLEKPAIATRYSGNLEFMDDSNSFLCGYNLRRIGPGCSPYQADARWAEPDLDEAARLMRFVYEHPDEAKRRAKKGRVDVCAGHDPAVVADLVKNRLTELRQQPPEAVPAAATVPERASVAKVRMAIQEGVNVRRTVPSLVTWLLQGPRRAMKKFLRLYDAHHRRVGLSALDAFKEIDAEWLRERASLRLRMAAQEEEIQLLKEELRKMRKENPPDRKDEAKR